MRGAPSPSNDSAALEGRCRLGSVRGSGLLVLGRQGRDRRLPPQDPRCGKGRAWPISPCEVGAFYWTVPAPDIVNLGREEQGLVSV